MSEHSPQVPDRPPWKRTNPCTHGQLDACDICGFDNGGWLNEAWGEEFTDADVNSPEFGLLQGGPENHGG